MRATHPVRIEGNPLLRSHPFLRSLCAIALAAVSPWLFCASPARAADWPPVPPEDLALKDNPAQPGSKAMYLNREMVFDGNNWSESYYIRIKIFSEEGKDAANIEIPMLRDVTDVKDIHARTVHPDGQAIEFDGNVLEKEVVRAGQARILVKSFSFPDVTPGSIVEYRYKITYAQVYQPPQNYPLILYNISLPVVGNLYTRTGHYVYKPYISNVPLNAGLSWEVLQLPPKVAPQKQKDGSYVLDVSNVPGIPTEDYMMPEEEVRGRVEFIYRTDDVEKEPQDYWNKVAKKWFGEEESFVGRRSDIKQAADQAVSGADSPEAKLQKLYARAQQIHNQDNDSDRTQQEENRDKSKTNSNASDVLKRGYGTSLDVDRFFIALAQAEGFDAGSVWAATRDRGMFHSDLQDSGELKDEFVWVRVGDKDYFLDPAVDACPFSMLPWYETAISVLRPTKQGAVFMNVPVSQSTESVIARRADLTLDPHGEFTGTFNVRITGEAALAYRQDAKKKDADGKRKMMSEEIRSWLPSSARLEITNITGWDTPDQPLEVQCSLHMNGMLQSAGRRVLMPLSLYESNRRQMFEHSTRELPIYFHYPYEDTDDISVHLPTGWKVESLPNPQVVDPGGRLHYEITAKQDGSTLEVQRKLSVGAIIYKKEGYAAVRQFFGSAKAGDDQQAVLQVQAVAGGNN